MTEFRRAKRREYARAVAAANAVLAASHQKDWRDELLEPVLREVQQTWRGMDERERQALIQATIRRAAGLAGIVRAPNRPVNFTAAERERQVNFTAAERERQVAALYHMMSPEQRSEYDERWRCR